MGTKIIFYILSVTLFKYNVTMADSSLPWLDITLCVARIIYFTKIDIGSICVDI